MCCNANWMQQQYINILGFESVLGWHKAQLWWALRNCTLYLGSFCSCAAHYNAVLCCPENNWCNDMQVYVPVAHFKCHVLLFFLACYIVIYCACSHCRSQVHCRLYVLVHMFMSHCWEFCCGRFATQKRKWHLILFFQGFFFFLFFSLRHTYVHFNLCVSVTIYTCILILATQRAEAFNSLFFLLLVFMCTCVCEHVYVCTCLWVHKPLSGCCIFFLHTIPSFFFFFF